MLRCPGESTLRRIGADALGDATFAALEAHIERCPGCQAALERLARGGPEGSLAGIGRPAGGGPAPAIPGFVVEREIGRGSFGVVYLAGESELGRQVALKVVPGGPVAGPRGRSRWLAEARAVSRLRHANVVRLYRVEETDEWLILVLEYVPGGTLKDRLDGPLPPRDAAGLVEVLARAVDEIHRSGLLHLDLKPSNILLDGDPGGPLPLASPKVSDFGIARAFGDPAEGEHATAGPRGTPSYMAPEQAVPGLAPIGPPADVYALGAVLYHALTGRPPFQAPTAFETIDQIRDEEPVPPRRLNPRVPADLETICLACLRKEPGRRYASARGLAEDLRLWLDGRAIRARPCSAAERAARWVRRRPSVAALAVALAATVVASIVGLAALLIRSEAARRRAEDSQRLASRSLGEFELAISGALADRGPVEDGRLRDLIESARRLTAGIGPGDRIDPGILGSLGIIEQVLAWRLHDRPGHLDEARALLDESARLLGECARQSPGDPEARRRHLSGVAMAGHVAGLHGHVDEAERRYDEVIRLAREIPRDDRLLRLLFEISDGRRHNACLIGWHGNPDGARRLAEADLRMLESLAVSDAEAPDLRARVALNLASLSQEDRGFRLMGGLRGISPARWIVPGDAVRLAREWVAREAARVTADGPPDGEDADPEVWAAALVESMQGRCEALGLGGADVPQVMLVLAMHMQIAGAGRRKAEEIGAARRIEARFLCLARQVVARYPGRAESHMALSEAHVQVAKNASRVGTSDEVAEALLRSREAARRALAVAPELDAARRLLDDRDRRITRRLANRPS